MGTRTDEAIEILKAVCAGHGREWVEYHGLEDLGVTECLVSPWYRYGVHANDRQGRLGSIRLFADEIISRY